MAKDVLSEMVDILAQDPQRWQTKAQDRTELKKELEKVKAEAEKQAGIPDTKVYRMIVMVLGLIVILALLGSIGLLAVGKTTGLDIPIALGSTALGALAGTLVAPR